MYRSWHDKNARREIVLLGIPARNDALIAQPFGSRYQFLNKAFQQDRLPFQFPEN